MICFVRFLFSPTTDVVKHLKVVANCSGTSSSQISCILLPTDNTRQQTKGDDNNVLPKQNTMSFMRFGYEHTGSCSTYIVPKNIAKNTLSLTLYGYARNQSDVFPQSLYIRQIKVSWTKKHLPPYLLKKKKKHVLIFSLSFSLCATSAVLGTGRSKLAGGHGSTEPQ